MNNEPVDCQRSPRTSRAQTRKYRARCALLVLAGIAAGVLASEPAVAQTEPKYRFALASGTFTALRQGRDAQPCYAIDLSVEADHLDFLLYPNQPEVDVTWTPRIEGTCLDGAIRPRIHMKGRYVPTFVKPLPGDEPPPDFIQVDTTYVLDRYNCHDIDNCFWEPITSQRLSIKGQFVAGNDIPPEAKHYTYTTDNGGTWEGLMSFALLYERYEE